MLTRLYCDNFKCLDNFEFRPEAMQLLMGRNGAGKSTVFEVLELLRDFAVRGEDCQTRFGGNTFTRWKISRTQRFEIDVRKTSGLYTYELVVEGSWSVANVHVTKERLSFEGNSLYLFENGVVHLHNDRFERTSEFPIVPKRSYLSEIESRPDNSKLMWFKAWLDRVLCVQIDPKRMRAGADKESIYPLSDLSNFAEWYRHLRQESSAATDRLRASLARVLDGFDGLDLKGPPSGTKELQVALCGGEPHPEMRTKPAADIWKESVEKAKTRPRYYTFNELSDGQRALIGLYTLLHCALTDHSTLCIDEPDNFIALSEIQPWLLQLLDRAQETSSQLFIASHHPELLNQLATHNGVILERTDAGPARVRPFAPPDDTTLTPAEIVARGWEHV